jgi:hypothetical protein
VAGFERRERQRREGRDVAEGTNTTRVTEKISTSPSPASR